MTLTGLFERFFYGGVLLALQQFISHLKRSELSCCMFLNNKGSAKTEPC